MSDKLREPRAIVLVLDSVGAGELPDAAAYGDVGSNTLGNTSRAVGGLSMPVLGAMGLGNITPIAGVPSLKTPVASWGRNAERSAGKDTTTGHWEMMGLMLERPFPTYPHGFPAQVIAEFCRLTGYSGVLGNTVASGTVIINELGDEHMATGLPIVYTSADSVFQIAAHEERFGLDNLYDACEIARAMLTGEHCVGRVIARPFVGPDEDGVYQRTHRRRDFAVKPFEPTVLDLLQDAGVPVFGVGKIGDIFAWQAVTSSPHVTDNMDGFDRLLAEVSRAEQGFVFCNLVDFDMLWGHRNDVRAYADGLEAVDRRMPELLDAMIDGDLLIITADHGCDPTTDSTDHSREHTPLIAKVKGVDAGVDLGTRATFGDIGETVLDFYGLRDRCGRGDSFLEEVRERVKSIEELIEIKRDGGTHTEDELKRLVDAFVSGEMPDYQMAAWLMAAFIRGLNSEETAALTEAMARSGVMMDLSSIPGVKVDKHSTGGVGDTTTIVLAPLVASCGVPVAKMSGRGLGFTGGTLDKLESIPGFSVTLELDAFLAQVRDVGVAVIGQTPDVDPADKKMYALRDVTATVPSVPLIVGSIISKKVAGGADAIVLDVKVGSGAFMKTEDDARALAAELTRVGELLGRKVVCILTDMDQPLGCAVGNALEVREAILTLRGEGPPDLTELCLVLGAKMLVLGRVAADESGARDLLLDSIASGRALATFRAWVAAQGGDPDVADDLSLLPLGVHARVVVAPRGGWVTGFDAEGVGRAAMELGAGRARKEDSVDPGAGLEIHVKTGTQVAEGDPLGTLYTNDLARLDEAAERLLDAVHIGDAPCEEPPLFLEA